MDDVAGTNVSGARPMNDVRNAASTAAHETGAAPGDQGKPGTMLSRGTDEVLGTNISGAHPENEMGTTRSTTGSTTGQASPRADDDGKIIPRQPDGAPGNPKGTELSRGVDEALGPNISGAHPENNTRR
jgi:hypothetical protein